MAQLVHQFTSGKADSTDSTLINPSNWNAAHAIPGTGLMEGIASGNLLNFYQSDVGLKILRRNKNNSAFEFVYQSGFRCAADYDFPAQTPGSSLNSGSNPITLSPVPLGVNGSDVGHYVYISGGTGGAAEAVLITGGTAVAGAASGTIIVSCANSHSGTWTVSSATGGIQEAISSLAGSGSVLVDPLTPATLHATVAFPTNGNRIAVAGLGKFAYGVLRASDYANGDLFSISSGGIVSFSSLSINNQTVAAQTSGAAIHYTSSSPGITDVAISGGYQGVLLTAASVGFIDLLSFYSSYAGTRAAVESTGATADIHFGGCRFYNVSGSYGMMISGGDTLLINNCTFGFCALVQLNINPAAGNYVSNILVSNCEFDTATTSSIAIYATTAGTTVSTIFFTGCNILGEGTATGIGLDISFQAPPNGTISDIMISNCSMTRWGLEGFAALNVTRLTLSNVNLWSNNTSNTALRSGAWIYGGSAILLENVRSTGGNQKYGITFSSTVSDVVMTGGSLSGNVTSAVNWAVVPSSLTINGVNGINPPWMDCTFSNGWGNPGAPYANVGYRADTEGQTMLRMRGVCSGGTVTDGTVILNLPAGFRPAKQQIFNSWDVNNTKTLALVVTTAGDVKIYGASAAAWVSFDNINLRLN